jgi:hypothetical protein
MRAGRDPAAAQDIEGMLRRRANDPAAEVQVEHAAGANEDFLHHLGRDQALRVVLVARQHQSSRLWSRPVGCRYEQTVAKCSVAKARHQGNGSQHGRFTGRGRRVRSRCGSPMDQWT